MRANRLSVKETVVLPLLAFVALLAPGCKQLDQTFTFDKRILVKVAAPPGEPQELATPDGWRFKPIVAASATNQSQPQPAEWYMVWRPGQKKSDLRRKHGKTDAWETARRDTPQIAAMTHEVLGSYPWVIEPNLIFGRKDLNTNMNHYTPRAKPSLDATPPLVVFQQQPSPAWPMVNDPLWHLGTNYSQLAAARRTVEGATPGMDGQIRIGILDCGFDGSHAMMPERIEDDPEGNAVNVLDAPGRTNSVSPGETGTGHGTGTLSLLAGRKVAWQTTNGFETNYLGADPHATIVPALISPWVVSLETADLAYGIDYASRRKHCDVISMSNGGAPCLIWADAVNAAYERGTAIFAACGDFYSFVGTDLGFIVPSATVYPAAFRRVVGVTGVTAQGKTYAKNACWRLLLHPLNIGDWLARGSYGGDMQGQHFLGVAGAPDNAEIWDNGMLHAFPIAAYTPNTLWAASSLDTGATNEIDLNGSGTSAATPQVAAAAALWLRKNYQEIHDDNAWNTWKKAESVYVALMVSAQRAKADQPDHYLGAGLLRASDALTNDYRQISAMEDTRKDRSENERAHRDPPSLGFSVAPQDYFDGQRSFKQMIFPWRHQPAVSQRADLRQAPKHVTTQKEALKTIYFNGFLLEQFQKGNTPTKGSEEEALDKRAEKMAQNAPSLFISWSR